MLRSATAYHLAGNPKPQHPDIWSFEAPQHTWRYLLGFVETMLTVRVCPRAGHHLDYFVRHGPCESNHLP